MPEPTLEVWYRVEDRTYSTCSIDAAGSEQYGTAVTIRTLKFPVLKLTPRGAWLDTGAGSKRFALREAQRRYACPTLEEARESFRARKQAQIRILREQIERIDYALGLLSMEECGNA
jgi:hypothetical protein